MYVCLCKGLAESDIHRAAQCAGAHPDSLITTLGLDDDDCCGRCVENIQELVTIASTRCFQCPLAPASAGRLDTQSGILR
jgi:bacterioferritin-associated ferredoxin